MHFAPTVRQLAVLLYSSKTETVLCYLLPSDPSLLRPMSATNHSGFFFTILPGFVLSPVSHPLLVIPPANSVSSFKGGKLRVYSYALLSCYLDTGEIPRDAVLLLPDGAQPGKT